VVSSAHLAPQLTPLEKLELKGRGRGDAGLSARSRDSVNQDERVGLSAKEKRNLRTMKKARLEIMRAWRDRKGSGKGSLGTYHGRGRCKPHRGQGRTKKCAARQAAIRRLGDAEISNGGQKREKKGRSHALTDDRQRVKEKGTENTATLRLIINWGAGRSAN